VCREEAMKQIAKIALFVVLLLGGVVQFVWCEDDAEQHSKELNSEVKAVRLLPSYQTTDECRN
ncbi:MAG: hypothetical protein D3906_05965, partial [Candidatus Electrothrix sp. AUS1_2]|nr:hypothetical protein [Candidatus Electrothrix sp. AUS1_2]